MKDSMRFVYQQTGNGWKMVFEGQSFQDACNKANELKKQTGIDHCVNSK